MRKEDKVTLIGVSVFVILGLIMTYAGIDLLKTVIVSAVVSAIAGWISWSKVKA